MLVASRHLVLKAQTASDLMVGNPHSLRAIATVREAAAFRPVGVLSKSDILAHYFKQMNHPFPSDAGIKPIEELITPVVFSVRPDTPVAKVMSEFTNLNVGQLFVVDHSGNLVGTIRAQEFPGYLQPPEST